MPAFAARTERYHELVGSLTYLSVAATALLASGRPDTRAVVVALLVAVWALRLGVFLCRRVHADGGDARFDGVKRSGPRFFVAWTPQAAWVMLTLAAPTFHGWQ